MRFGATATTSAAGRAEIELARGRRFEVASDGTLASPVEFLLGALASCQVLTYQHVAEAQNVPLDSVTVRVEGSLDPATLDGAARPCVSDVVVHVELRGPSTPERYEQLANEVDRRCPVHATLERDVAITRQLAVV
ncbi:OsmC family protein [Acidimicrobium ferrooxidans DSM 10331]|uniref:OsmC family protein n=1 Tax=Acidimicrobium ferrooxidans (strain DSM 10331 / JCM 15462 / NBRC 103882 / ICP) TaxID=525909 RepID=C7LZ49_ACIFD|nr:OsmC family protein [Acidimicrobium ferrooxidans]ACU54007.1 OsmC family protein [Acidimicrobium ferrooxidans DSM 10331]